jgi:OmcA/MtrC family decaheme c-type cytochrome
LKNLLARTAPIALLALVIAGCGSDSGGGSNSPGTGTALSATIAAAAAVPANDTSINSSAPFTVLQGAGVPAVAIKNGVPVVNFTVFDNGAVVKNLVLANASFAIAKITPGTNSNPDQWTNYVSQVKTAGTSTGPAGQPPALASAIRASTDPKPTGSTQLAYNADGYYSYTFTAKITDPAWTSTVNGNVYKSNGVTFEPGKAHRIAIQLNYVNAAGETVRVNPYFDVTFDANGNSIPVTAAVRKMVDVGTCNNCHGKLSAHGGNRVDTQFCVMCHNPGSQDVVSGNVVTFSTMVHSIHAGKLLQSNGVDYYIGSTDFADVGFPQDMRNCNVCHSATADPVGSAKVVATPQGNNWKNKPTREACLSCHASQAGSNWFVSHTAWNAGNDPNTGSKPLTNADCATCHLAGTIWGSDRVHYNQIQTNAAKYKVNIASATYDAATRMVTVKYNVTDPTNGNKAYNLVTSECTGSGATAVCANTTTFGNLRFYLGYQNLIGQPGPTDWTAWGNGGSGANAYLYQGTNDGANTYTVKIPVPADVAGVSKAGGSARVVSIGQVKEAPLQILWATDPRPVASTEVADRLNVGVQHSYVDLALDGTLSPRRDIVATDKCNVCHGLLGTASASNTLVNTTTGSSGASNWNAFHSGARNTVEGCPVCHDANRASTGSIMTNGLNLYESFQAKRFIHGIHGGPKRTYPFAHGNTVVGAFNTDGSAIPPWTTPMSATAENYGEEVQWPDGNGINCNACHVNNSQLKDRSAVGSMVMKPAGATDPLQWLVITPKAATCTSCHDGTSAKVGRVIDHVILGGGAGYANLSKPTATQATSWTTLETCDDCHAPGSGAAAVDLVHMVK